MDDDLLPKGFYNQPKHANLPRDQRIHPQSNQVPTNADENLPENFYKFRPTATNFDRSSSGPTAHEQLGVQPQPPCGVNDFSTFDIERRLKLLKSESNKSRKVTTSNIEARLNKLKGEIKPPPSVADIEARLRNLSNETAGATSTGATGTASGAPATDLTISPKKRKTAPLITVMSINEQTTPDDLVDIVQQQLGLDKPSQPNQKTLSPSQPVSQMTPEELLAFVKNEKFDQPDSEASDSEDLISSDGTHESFESDLITDDEGSVSDEGNISYPVVVSHNNKVSRKEWRGVVRDILKSDKGTKK